mgnify:CR=1 FL=1
MENHENQFSDSFENNNLSEQPKLTLTPYSIEFLKETAKWTRFISLVGLVIIGLYIIMMVFMSSFFSRILNEAYTQEAGSMGMANFFSPFYIIIMILILLIYVIPIWWLYKFSTKMNAAILLNNSDYLQESLNFLRRHYKFIGILVVIMLVFYVLAFIGGMLGGLIGAINS